MNVEILLSQYFQKKEWGKARDLLVIELDKNPDNHWLLTRLATTHYEEKSYNEALKLSRKALKLAPKCPLVRWDLACDLDMVGRVKEAIKVWKELLRQNIEDLAYGECGEGMRWAKSMLNDSRYRIAKAYLRLNQKKLAQLYMDEHLKNRTPGLPSIYSLREAKRLWATIHNAKKS